MEKKQVDLRCKLCNGRFSLDPWKKTTTCPQCKQDWNIRWFAEDTAMIISPVSWKSYAERERTSEAIRKE